MTKRVEDDEGPDDERAEDGALGAVGARDPAEQQAPKKATNWTSRIAWISVSSSSPSSSEPYVAENEIAVWMPSLKHR